MIDLSINKVGLEHNIRGAQNKRIKHPKHTKKS